MPKANVDGLQMYYEIGRGAGSPVIFIAGLSGDHLGWAMQVPAVVAAGHRCIVFDNRDVGQTDESPVAVLHPTVYRRHRRPHAGARHRLGAHRRRVDGRHDCPGDRPNYPERVMSHARVHDAEDRRDDQSDTAIVENDPAVGGGERSLS